MKKLFSIVICVMTLLFSGCEENAPATSSKVDSSDPPSNLAAHFYSNFSLKNMSKYSKFLVINGHIRPNCGIVS